MRENKAAGIPDKAKEGEVKGDNADAAAKGEEGEFDFEEYFEDEDEYYDEEEYYSDDEEDK